MNIYGDRGNILTLVNRCRWRDIQIEVINIEVGDKLTAGEIDLFFWGGGQDREQILASSDLKGDKAKILRESIEDGAALLAICGGYQLLGKYYKPSQGTELDGVGIFDAHTIGSNKRMIGNLVVETDRLSGKLETLVGFENHSGKTHLGKTAQSLGNVLIGFGNNSEDRTEGCIYKNAIGCYLHGPALPKNPMLADFLILKGLQHKDRAITKLKPLDDTLELQTHLSILERIKNQR